jgi:hypothetical protein
MTVSFARLLAAYVCLYPTARVAVSMARAGAETGASPSAQEAKR